MPELEASYVLPLRRDHDSAGPELAAYLRRLAGLAEVLVVDGSPEPVWRAHHQAFGDRVTHLRPDPGLAFANSKVNGVLTGLAAAGHEAVVLADDDVRYDQEGLRRLVGLLKAADLVRPQNYFAPLPWHASLDTARTLLNRVAGGDFPGTLAVRRSLVLDAGGYDGDVLFENLELLRTVRAAGGTVLTPLDLYVRRLPPGAGHFLGQRVRQAYDELARPARLAAALAVLPRGGRPGRPAALVAAGRSGRPGRSRRRDRPPPGRRAGRVPGLQQPAGAGVAAGARGQLVAGRARPPVPGRRHLRRRPAAPGGHPRAGPAGPPGRQGQCPGRP